MGMFFEWHPKKAADNLKKHGIEFEEAKTVFTDPYALVLPDEAHSEDETREIVVGYSNKNRLLLVNFVERVYHVIRLISARRATQLERQDYEENAQNQNPHRE